MIFAEERSCQTQFELGEMFRENVVDKEDYNQSAEWFKRSAQQGYSKAQYKIGLMYARGVGVCKDYIKAYAWLKVAASQGSQKAMTCLAKLSKKMSPDQLKLAQQKSRDYYQRFVVPFA
mgnify:CR=1 FL=1